MPELENWDIYEELDVRDDVPGDEIDRRVTIIFDCSEGRRELELSLVELCRLFVQLKSMSGPFSVVLPGDETAVEFSDGQLEQFRLQIINLIRESDLSLDQRVGQLESVVALLNSRTGIVSRRMHSLAGSLPDFLGHVRSEMTAQIDRYFERQQLLFAAELHDRMSEQVKAQLTPHVLEAHKYAERAGLHALNAGTAEEQALGSALATKDIQGEVERLSSTAADALAELPKSFLELRDTLTDDFSQRFAKAREALTAEVGAQLEVFAGGLVRQVENRVIHRDQRMADQFADALNQTVSRFEAALEDERAHSAEKYRRGTRTYRIIAVIATAVALALIADAVFSDDENEQRIRVVSSRSQDEENTDEVDEAPETIAIDWSFDAAGRAYNFEFIGGEVSLQGWEEKGLGERVPVIDVALGDQVYSYRGMSPQKDFRQNFPGLQFELIH